MEGEVTCTASSTLGIVEIDGLYLRIQLRCPSISIVALLTLSLHHRFTGDLAWPSESLPYTNPLTFVPRILVIPVQTINDLQAARPTAQLSR